MFQEVNDLILRSNQGYLVHDMGEPLFANQALADLVGLPDVEAVMAMPTAFALIHPDDRELVIKNATYRIEGQEDIPIDYEFRLIRQPDDEELWINCRAFPINWNSRPALAVSFFDVTDRKNLEAEQERLNHLFTNMFELTPLIITLTRHSDGRYIMVNGSFERTLGYSKAEATGRTPMELGVYDNQNVRDQNFKALEIGETRINNEIIGIAKDGRRFMASFSSTRLNVYGEDLILFIGRDITDERKQQEALQSSKEAAELADRTKTEFLANMSHELRTPLNAILGFSEAMKDDQLGEIDHDSYQNYASAIFTSGQHLLGVINDILDMSRIEAGKMNFVTENLNLKKLMDQCIPLIRDRLHESDLSLDININESISLHADRLRMKQVFINLLSNAIKFTAAGGKITIKAAVSQDGDLNITFTDTGIGMSGDDIEKAMEPFGQVQSTLSRQYEGAGLGLPLSAKFVRHLGGDIKIDSEPEQGTTIIISFPSTYVKVTF